LPGLLDSQRGLCVADVQYAKSEILAQTR